jgi:chromosome segregation ATPase
LVEHEIDGLLRRRIEYSVKDANGSRNLDYTNLLNEKENQIIELERKILNLEARFKQVGAKENELANQVAQLSADLKRKDEIIKLKNDLIISEYARSNDLKETILRLRRTWESSRNRGELNNLFDGVVVPTEDIRVDSLTRDGATRGAVAPLTKTRGALVTLFREF